MPATRIFTDAKSGLSDLSIIKPNCLAHSINWCGAVLLVFIFSNAVFGQIQYSKQYAKKRDSLKVAFAQESNPDNRIALALQIALNFPGNAKADSMLHYANVASALFKQSTDSTKYLYDWYFTVIIANTYLGNFKEALKLSKVYDPILDEVYQRVMSLKETELQEIFKNSTPPTNAHNALGELYRKFGDLEQALHYHLRALQCAEKNTSDIRLLADSYNNVGIVYDLLNQYANAISFYKRSAAINIGSAQRKFNLASNYNNLGIVYKNLKKYDSAATYYKLGVALMEETFNAYGKAVLLDNIGILYTQQGEYDKAIEVEYEALALQKKTGSKEQQAMILLNIANNFYLKEDYVKAENLGLQAYELSAGNDLAENKRKTSELLGKIYEAKGNYKEALRFFKIFKETADTLINEAKNEAISNLQIRYETEKKESENKLLQETNAQQAQLNWILSSGGILLLVLLSLLGYFFIGKQKANTRLASQNHQIEQNLKEKEALLREIHHRVKNNLQVISSLLNMQSYHLEDAEMINAIAEGQSRVKAMALIHEKLYQTEQLSEIDFQEYTEQLISYLASAFGTTDKRINSKVSGANIKLDINTAIPLGLILNELITNAYKYAFKDATQGDIKIDLALDGKEQYKLTVADNGKGLPADFNESKLNSLGLKLVKMLTEQLEGNLTIKNDMGAQFLIRFRENRLSA